MDKDYDRPKKSWRELDQQKDSSPHRKQDKPVMGKFKQERANIASKSYRAKLDNLFDGGGEVPSTLKEKFNALEDSKEGKQRKELAKEIIDARSSIAKNSAVKKYLTHSKLPPDYSILIEVLSCSDEEYQEQALLEIEKLIDLNRKPKRSPLLEQRLKSLISLSDDEEIQDSASTILNKLANLNI